MALTGPPSSVWADATACLKVSVRDAAPVGPDVHTERRALSSAATVEAEGTLAISL